MIRINEDTGDISYTKDDTFKMTAYTEHEGYFKEGSKMKFIIAQTEESDYLIEKTVNINDDLTFTLTLDDREKGMLNIGDYIYKLVLLENNSIVTQISGHFEVKWGA